LRITQFVLAASAWSGFRLGSTRQNSYSQLYSSFEQNISYVRVLWEYWLFSYIQEHATDGVLKFDEQGRESNSNRANNRFPTTLHPQG
jgi:hypothetical protein